MNIRALRQVTGIGALIGSNCQKRKKIFLPIRYAHWAALNDGFVNWYDVGGTNLRVGVVEFSGAQTQHNQIQASHLHLLEEIRFQADFSSLCKLHQHAANEAWKTI